MRDVFVDGVTRGDAEGKPSFAADVDGVMTTGVAVEALWVAVTCSMSFVLVFVWARKVVVFGVVPFAALVAPDGITWHGTAVGNVAEFVASAALGEGKAGYPLGKGDQFPEHGKVQFFHGLCVGAILVYEGKRDG